MKARPRAQKQIHRSLDSIKSGIRPLCRAIAMAIAAGAASGTVHAAGLVNLANLGSRINATRATGGAGMTNLGVGVSPQQALQASQPSIRNLATAAQSIAQQIAAQQSAAAAAASVSSNVPNGLAPGGLQVAPGVTFQKDSNGNYVPSAATANPNNPVLWVNANAPQETIDPNGHVTVTVPQTGQSAVATWQTMNVGSNTTLNFDQSKGAQTNGANNWVILNRIMDPSGRPSQILGQVTAQGTVLVINRNGILFGPGSQVNVHSLIASSLEPLNTNDNIVETSADIVLSNQLFLSPTGGLATAQAGTSSTSAAPPSTPNELLGLGNNVSVTSASSYQPPGDITIAPGASITTSADGSASNGGFVLIAAPNVSNGGNVTVAPTGQVVLAAGVGVSFQQSSSSPHILLPELTGRITSGASDITPAGTLTNTGIIQANRGQINLLGGNVAQNGVVAVTTSVNTPGSITISTVDEGIANPPSGSINGTSYSAYTQTGAVNATGLRQLPTNRAGQLTFGNGSVTAVLPDTDGETATSSGTTFTPGSITMTAGSVWFQSGSLIEAPGSTVSVAALTPSSAGDTTPLGDTAVQGRIYVDNGASIDVSGLANVELSISDILLTLPTITANELADSPLLRMSFLNGLKNVVVDSTLSGTNADGLQWVGSPILNLAGQVSLMPRTVDQLLTNGGTITMAGNEVMSAGGSQLNLNGGYIHYLGAMVNTTRLVDANGAIVPIGQAGPYDTYVGVAGQFVERHSRWNITNTWVNPLLNGGTYEGDYIVGGNAGTLNVFASTAMVLDGGITANAFAGEKQVQGNAQTAGGTFSLGATAFAPLTDGPNSSVQGEPSVVILQDNAPHLASLSPGFGANTPLDTSAISALPSTDPGNVLATMVVPVNTLDSGGFSNVTINNVAPRTSSNGIVVAAGTQLNVQPGGSINLKSLSGGVSVLGSLIAPSGTISISAIGNVDVGPGATISVAGQWVNNDVQRTPGTTRGGSEYINGGSITLSAPLNSTLPGPVDTTGSIILEPGSLIDVSSGGEIQANGKMLLANGIPEGKAGSLSLITYANNASGPYGSGDANPNLPASQPTAGRIGMNGTIDSFGFSGGGTLTLQALGFQIGGDPREAPLWDLYLPANFFAQQGFGKYVLNAMYDGTIAAGAVVPLTQQNLIPNVPALQQASTGADVTAAGLTTLGTLDAYHRQPTSLVMTAGAYVAWQSQTSQRPQYAGVTGGVTLGEGAAIVGDAGSTIGLGSPTQVTVLGSIKAPGGAITLSADSLGSQFSLPGQETTGSGFSGFTSHSKSVWLGPDAVLDVSGVALVNPLAAPVKNGLQTIVPNTGKVLPGGSVTISDDSGYVVAQSGASINASGASAIFDEQQSSGLYAPQQVWSNAGSITLAASSGLLFDGTLQALPGAGQAQGGTLTILPEQGFLATNPTKSPGAQILILQQSGTFVPAGLTLGGTIADAVAGTGQDPTGVLNFAVDRLAGSGIATLDIGQKYVVNTASSVTPVLPVAFSGNVDLTLPGAVVINTGHILALSSGEVSALERGAIDPSSGNRYTVSSLLDAQTSAAVGTTVSISAPYVALTGTFAGTGFSPVEAVGDGRLNINAGFIDLENQFQLNNFGLANFNSSGDIRLTSTIQTQLNLGNTLVPGELITPGSLTFQAANLYPSTGTTYILDAVAPVSAGSGPAPTTITFLGNGASASSTPLSAGGTLLLDATNIVQGGTVRAPSGTLVFGVGDPTNLTTQTQFNNLPLVATDSVSFLNGSITSVSNGGAFIPYGTTVDGVEWQFNPVPNAKPLPDVTAPPSKFMSVNGSKISLNAGATIDLSGGGDLQAEEWVPGTGGTRDVLSQYQVSYATTPGGIAIPTNVGAANVYAIMPGQQSPVAAYDPIFAQTLQPSVTVNGAATTTTNSMGVGQAGLSNGVGESVYLSGVPGLAPGFYTLLPAKYATLPGAYRVTVSSTGGQVTPGSSAKLPDGTIAVAGYMGNALTGARSSAPVLFDVQSGAVWQQYSQYTFSRANSFFPPLASNAGNLTPPLPMDAGQLVLAASQSLALGATLKTTAAPGGAPAQVDIASQAIQIVGSGETALPGYLQLSAEQLDALNAGSLLIGGTRTQGTSGITITPIATSVVVANDAANPLTGSEVILVSANTLQVDSGSVIEAKGSYPAAKDVPIAIAANTATGTSDGALLSVSNGGSSVITRTGTLNRTGLLTVAAGASLSGGQALTLDSSGNMTFDPAASMSGNTIAIDGSAITFTSKTGASAASLPGFVIGPAQIAQLANSQDVILRSTGAINFDGTTDLTFGNQIDLSAGMFQGDGGSATINASQVTLNNELGAPNSPATSGGGTLTVNASRINFGNGNATVSGFGSVAMNAASGIVAEGNGTLDFGAVPVTLNAPVYLADTGSSSTIRTTGALALNGAAGTALKLQGLGGAFSFIGGTINDNGASIAALAGNITLEATRGNLTVSSGSTISSAGVALPFFDITEFAPAGSITLTSDKGSVNVASGAVLDFSGASGGGAAGSLKLSAPSQAVNLAGTIKGNATSGYSGGSFSLSTGGAVNLDNLAGELASSGVNNAITVDSNAGNLTLSAGNTLTAHKVSLTADGRAGGQDPNNGNVRMDGTINAAGNAGGEIDLYGRSGVNIQGSLIATGSSATQQGGTVNIGTTGKGSTTSLNSTYGYENVLPSASGIIKIGRNAVIDVSGGTAGGLSGGTVSFRAPILTHGTVNVSIAPTAQIKGSRATTLQAYAVWSTDDRSTHAARHFDGIVDPAGWYDSNGHLVAGTFTSQDGQTTITYTPANGNTPASLSNLPAGATPAQVAAALASDLESDYFVPATANASHQTFYGYNGGSSTNGPGTLMGFVESGVQTVANQFAGSNIANFAVVPGVDLVNPDPKINSGNISVLTNWNLGAGSSTTNLAFRFNGQAPVITFRAENNVNVKASLTDGFFQIANPVTPGASTTFTVPPLASYSDVYTLLNTPSGRYNTTVEYYLTTTGPYQGIVTTAPQNLGTSTADEEYYALYKAYLTFLTSPGDASAAPNFTPGETYLNFIAISRNGGTPTVALPTAPSSTAQASNPDLYFEYLVQYQAYVDQITAMAGIKATPPVAPAAQPVAVVNPSTTNSVQVTLTSPPPVDNSASPVATSANPLPLQFASLTGGNSSTFNVVAGANVASSNPLALQAASLFAQPAGGSADIRGSVILSGNFAYNNANDPTSPNALTVLTPTMIRTGTGSINVAAGNDIWLFDPNESTLVAQAAPLLQSAPGVIYAGGAPSPRAPVGNSATIINGDPSNGISNTVVSPMVSPDAAGNVSLVAQGNITGMENVVDVTGAVTGIAGANISQFWQTWLEIGNPVDASGQTTQTSVNFGAFDQGVMSVGGNVSVSAGGNVTDLSVSLPTTWYQSNANGNSAGSITTVGGGNLTVTAGGNILSGAYFVANGTGTITAGGRIASDGLNYTSQSAAVGPVSTLLATQDGVLNVSARQGVDIGAMLNPSYLGGGGVPGDSSTSAVNVTATTGDIAFGTLTQGQLPWAGGTSGLAPLAGGPLANLPASISLVALAGGISVDAGGTLAASSTGNLKLIANQTINLNATSESGNFLNQALIMPGVAPSLIDETEPVRIYSLTGSIVDGVLEPAGAGNAGFYDKLLNVTVDKPAFIEAGQNIVNLSFTGQNLSDDDVTRIVAGRDIYDTPLAANANVAAIPSLQLGGPGYFDIEAGRNMGPLTSQAQVFNSLPSYPPAGVTTGIDAVGNANNPALPHKSASIDVLFGIGPGVDDASFISTYINPASSAPGIPSTTQALITFMAQYNAGHGFDTGPAKGKPASLSASEAWSQFQALPPYVQRLFVEQVFFSILTDVGNDFNNPSSPFFNQYARGYQAINTLFPSSLGYTANALGGGSNGANALVQTGNLDIRSTTIQTQQGGNVSILGPGGEALIGSTGAPPAIVSGNQIVAGPGTQGILTLEKGDINIFTDQSLLLAQSRVFTEQGGNMTIWSSNGNIDAGKGSTSVADIPPALYVCDANHYCTLDAKGEVTGAGIATLQTIPGSPPGNVNLLAPRGTVDAGAAGIRVSGNLNVAALQVLNAANIQVQGKATGIPVVAAVDTGALTAASAASSAVTQMAQNLVRGGAASASTRPWVISVEVEGFGDPDGLAHSSDQLKKKQK